MVTTEVTTDNTRIILSPNRSIEWQDIKYWLVILSLPAVIVGIGWWIVGVWMILPFVGLELGLLTFFMYRVCYLNYRQQQITVAPSHVTIETGVNNPTLQHRFSRPDCYLNVNKPTKPIDNFDLALSNQDQSLAIGEFLNPRDRELARKSLGNAGLVECSSRWWK